IAQIGAVASRTLDVVRIGRLCGARCQSDPAVAALVAVAAAAGVRAEIPIRALGIDLAGLGRRAAVRACGLEAVRLAGRREPALATVAASGVRSADRV